MLIERQAPQAAGFPDPAAGEPFLLTPGPLTTAFEVKQAMLRDWGSWDGDFRAMTAELRRRLVAISGAGEDWDCVPVQGSGTFAVEAMLTTYPGVKILWAHAGMSASAQRVGALVDRYPMLWVELALRSDVAPGGVLDPGWRQLFLRHPDRFLVGTDTWVTPRWESVRDGHEAVQRIERQPLAASRLHLGGWRVGVPANGRIAVVV